MFETDGALTSDHLRQLVDALSRLDSSVDDAERIDQIRALERVKAATAAAQATVSSEFAASQDAAQAAAGVRAKDRGRGIAAQVGLAKRESPARAGKYVGWAGVLVSEFPHTLAALRCGETTEWRAMVVARETGWLSAEHRAVVDAQLGPRLEALGDRQTEAEAKKAAYRLDPHGFMARIKGAEADRRVTLRPAPDTMARLTGFLPVAQGVAAFASLNQHADALISAGDPRGRGQIMADTLVERVTGQATADAVPVEINLVLTDQVLFNRDAEADQTGTDQTGTDSADEPAHLDGYGPVPADLARRLVGDVPAGTAVWLRRLYTDPDSGALVAMESRRRFFDDTIRRFLVVRDQICRTPWCNAPIRHLDHPIPVAEGGETSAVNGQSLCEACNYAKQAPGWQARPGPGGAGDQVVITTPTGHHYPSRPPDPPGRTAARAPTLADLQRPSRIEELFRKLILAA